MKNNKLCPRTIMLEDLPDNTDLDKVWTKSKIQNVKHGIGDEIEC